MRNDGDKKGYARSASKEKTQSVKLRSIEKRRLLGYFDILNLLASMAAIGSSFDIFQYISIFHNISVPEQTPETKHHQTSFQGTTDRGSREVPSVKHVRARQECLFDRQGSGSRCGTCDLKMPLTRFNGHTMPYQYAAVQHLKEFKESSVF